MFTARVKNALLDSRLDAGFYHPAYVQNEQFLRNSGWELVPLKDTAVKMKCGPFGSSLHASSYVHSGIPFISPVNFSSGFYDESKLEYISSADHARLGSTAFNSPALLFARVGDPCCIVVPEPVGTFNIHGDVIGVRCSERVDHHFVFAFLTSQYGRKELERYGAGSTRPRTNTESLASILILKAEESVQIYIGDKIRQAEQLRERASRLNGAIDALACPDSIRTTLKMQDFKFNRFAASGLDARLDGKYYGRRAMAVLNSCWEAGGVRISDLNPKVSNGFEYRDFSETGRPYITVTEVSSGRLDLATAPRIPADAKVPLKATINERCTLVVRTGSVGVAVKAHSEDAHACISSHLIRLEFDGEAESSAVTVWLNGPAGKCLQEKITYGGVQPQIAQDDLLALPIPRAVLNSADQILVLWEKREQCLRGAARLVTAAKALVEALIEGRIGEADLCSIQEEIARGGHMADRELLGRLTTTGLDMSNVPRLFPDLNAFQQTLKDGELSKPPEEK